MMPPEHHYMPAAARAAGFEMTAAMLGFPGEDYTTPQTIQHTGGFGNPATRAERLERLQWALQRSFGDDHTNPVTDPFMSRVVELANTTTIQGEIYGETEASTTTTGSPYAGIWTQLGFLSEG
jgi:hypothetical protein